jgi:serine/threonine protein kinase/tetratricopeptide (TPR) repeat protein
MSSCPWEAILPSVGTDALGDLAYSSIEQHVEKCPDCKLALEDLAHRWIERPLLLPGPERSPRIPGFEIQCELGRGGMGVVYLATETGLDRLVALKILPGAIGADTLPLARRRWLREARAVSSVRHPNVVPLYNYGEADGWLFLVLEYIPGGSLRTRLSAPLAPRVAAALVETVARAVGFIHARGLLHLDLKPSNILLDCETNAPWDRVVPRVADFGVALLDGPDDSTTSLAGPRGTPSYMAPEQTNGTPATIGPAADIYALGAILYELLTGRPPFQGRSAIETLDQVRGQEPVAPRRLIPAIPRDLETVCLKCLDKDPCRRYASSDSLATDLRRWLEGRPVLARPVSSFEGAWRWCRRRPVVAALVGSLLTSLFCGFLTTFLLWRYADAERIRAEAEQRRAEADYAVGRAALAEILDLGERTIEPTVVVTRDRAIASLQVARRRIQELANRRPSDPALWNQLAVVDLFLGRNLEYQGQFVEGETLYVESLWNWQKILEKTPRDLAALYRQWQTLDCLARVREHQGKMTESTNAWERATAAGECLLPILTAPDFNTMAECRSGLARLLAQQGDHDRASRILLANLQMLGSVPPQARTGSVERWLEQTWVELARIRCESGTVEEEEDWARQAIAQRPMSPDVDGRAATQVCETGYLLQRSLAEQASDERKRGRFDDARRRVGRMHALGRLLVTTYPDCSAAHLALSEAFRQSAKERFQTNDLTAVERSWKRALDEARQAVLVNSQDARARHNVVDLERRLRSLLSPGRDPQHAHANTIAEERHS